MRTTTEKQTCSTPGVQDDLKAFLDGELPPLRRWAVRVHVNRCAACRAEIDAMKQITTNLRASENGAALTPDLRSRILSRIASGNAAGDDDTADAPLSPRPLWRRRPGLVFGVGGATVAASLAVFLTLYQGALPTTSSVAPAPAGKSTLSTAASQPASFATSKYVQDYDKSVGGNDFGRDQPLAEKAVREPQSNLSGSVRGSSIGVIAGKGRSDSFYAHKVTQEVIPHGANPAAAPAASGSIRGNIQAQAKTAASAASVADAYMPNAITERQVYKEASLGIAVEGLEAASDRVEEMVKADGGYVASNQLTTDADGYKSAQLSVRVPTADFDTIMSKLSKLGNVVSKNLSGEDITEKTSDATTAEQVLINEANETEQKLKNQSMSERRTGQKEAELRQIRMQLAQTRARLGLLRRMASLATIEVSLTEKAKLKPHVTSPQSGFWSGMHETNHAAMLAFQTAVRVPLVLAIWVLAFSPIWVPLVIAYRYAALKALVQQKARAAMESRANQDI